jgi:nucleotide-binding universal stress UspA family protein
MSHHAPILATTDLSAVSRHAADRAALLAHETGAPLSLLHVLPGEALETLRQWLGADKSPAPQLEADARRQLEQIADDIKATRHVDVRPLLASGTVPEEVSRAAEALDAGLLVVGARGAGFLRRLMLGTTSARLIRRTTRPILVVRQIAHEPYRRALVAVDFSPSSAPALAAARRVAPHAQLVLLAAFQVPFEDKLQFAGVDAATIAHYRHEARAETARRLAALATAAGLKPGSWQPCVVEGDPSLRIVEQEQELDCDLVVLGKHGKGLGEELLLGSVTKHVLAEGNADALISTARRD